MCVCVGGGGGGWGGVGWGGGEGGGGGVYCLNWVNNFDQICPKMLITKTLYFKAHTAFSGFSFNP